MFVAARSLRIVVLLSICSYIHCQEDAEEDGVAKADSGKADEQSASDGNRDEEGDASESKVKSESPKNRLFSEEELRQYHRDVDVNTDTKLSEAELLNFTEMHYRNVELSGDDLKDQFTELDSNKDGTVDLQEYLNNTVSSPKQVEDETGLFKAADINGDGVLDKEEVAGLVSPVADGPVMETALKQSMRSADINADGRLTFDEFENAELVHHDRAPINHEEEDFHDRIVEGNQNQFTKDVFKQLDANSDGFVDQNELRELHSGRLQRKQVVDGFVEAVDKNNDRQITEQELLQARSSIRDSDIHSYLIAWAERRPVVGRAPKLLL